MKKNKMLIGLAVAAIGIGVILLAVKPTSRSVAVTLDGTAVQSRLGSIGYLYALYRESRGRSPASLEELNEFGRKLREPSWFNEEFLRLPRDKQPVVIRYDLKLLPPRARQETDGEGPIFGTIDGPILAHEQSGVNGRRFVVFAGSNRVAEVDDGVFQQSVQP